MKFVILFMISFILDITVCINLSEFALYLDPTTKLDNVIDTTLISQPNGVLIGRLNGQNTSFCVEFTLSFKAANVACELLNYKGELANAKFPDSLALSVSMSKSTSASTNYIIESCSATDCVVRAVRQSEDYRCLKHIQDLHIFCNKKYKLNTVLSCNSATPCKISRQNKFIQIELSNRKYYLCGRGNSLNQLIAETLCRGLNDPINFPQFLYNIGSSDSVGGFVNMACPANATDLSSCTGAYPLATEYCLPEDSVGLTCNFTVSQQIKVTPSVQCNNTLLTVTWDISQETHPFNSSYINIIMNNNLKCPDIIREGPINGIFRIYVPYTCSLKPYNGSNIYIIYTFDLLREYAPIDFKVIRDNDRFTINCLMSRETNSTNGALILRPGAINPGENNLNLVTKVSLYRSNNKPIQNLGEVQVNERIYAKVELEFTPPEITMVINRCYIDATPNINLVVNKCPTASDINIQIMTATVHHVHFNAFRLQQANEVTLKCDTTSCITQSNGCSGICGV